jgi:P-type E1-E2 ATPase
MKDGYHSNKRSAGSKKPRKRAAGGIRVSIPGRKRELRIDRVVFDFNGTLAVDGVLIRGVGGRIRKLAKLVEVVVMTADTFGTARDALAGLPITVKIARTGEDKRRFVKSCGAGTAVVGNGMNDVPMFRAAGFSIGVLGGEGSAAILLRTATVIVRDINDAFDLLLSPERLIATLRR